VSASPPETPGEPDAAALAAYRAEVRHVATAPLRLGVLLALLGVIAAVLRGTAVPVLPRAVPAVLIIAALGVMLVGVVRRARYHLKRIRDL
jgi:hypothetical protein